MGVLLYLGGVAMLIGAAASAFVGACVLFAGIASWFI